MSLLNTDEDQREETKEESKEDQPKAEVTEDTDIGIDIASLKPPEQEFVKGIKGLLIGMQTFKKLPAKKPPKPFDPLLGNSVPPEQCGY